MIQDNQLLQELTHTTHQKHCVGDNKALEKEPGHSVLQFDRVHACEAVGSQEQSCEVFSRYVRPCVNKPDQHDGFWNAQATEWLASSKTSDQSLGALALKYGLGTQYDPFESSALEHCMRSTAARRQKKIME